MTQWHLKSKTKISGGIRTSLRRCKKKASWRGGNFISTKIADEDEQEKRKIVNVRGTNEKQKLKIAKFANVSDKKNKKTIKAEILTVIDNQADRQFVRRNIITKGAIIAVKANGKERQAIVTSRPGQNGSISAVLLEPKEEVKKEKILEELEKKEKEEKLKEKKPSGLKETQKEVEVEKPLESKEFQNQKEPESAAETPKK